MTLWGCSWDIYFCLYSCLWPEVVRPLNVCLVRWRLPQIMLRGQCEVLCWRAGLCACLYECLCVRASVCQEFQESERACPECTEVMLLITLACVDIRLQPWLSKLRKILLLNLRLEVERLESLAPLLVPTGCGSPMWDPNNWHPGPGIFPHGNSALSFPCGSQAPQPFFCILSGTSQGLSGPTPRIRSWSCALPEQHDAPGTHSDFTLCGVTSRIQCERPWVEMGEESGPSTPPHSSGSKLKIHLVLL